MPVGSVGKCLDWQAREAIVSSRLIAKALYWGSPRSNLVTRVELVVKAKSKHICQSTCRHVPTE